MPTIAAIDRAIEAHGKWIASLLAAIQTGVSEFPIAAIRSDDACEFGEWLHGRALAADGQHSIERANVLELHAHFHNVAGRVVELAVGGKSADAQELLARDFDAASKLLLAAMQGWKDKLRAEAPAAGAAC